MEKEKIANHPVALQAFVYGIYRQSIEGNWEAVRSICRFVKELGHDWIKFYEKALAMHVEDILSGRFETLLFKPVNIFDAAPDPDEQKRALAWLMVFVDEGFKRYATKKTNEQTGD